MTEPKLKLKRGLRATNVVVHRDGRAIPETLQPDAIYQGEEYHRWVPSVLVPVDAKVTINSLKVPDSPPHRRGARRMRRKLAPDAPPPTARVKATLEKKHIEKGQERKEQKAPEPAAPRKPPTADAHPERAPDLNENRRQRLRGFSKRISSMSKADILEFCEVEGFEVNSRSRVNALRKQVKALIIEKLKKLAK